MCLCTHRRTCVYVCLCSLLCLCASTFLSECVSAHVRATVCVCVHPHLYMHLFIWAFALCVLFPPDSYEDGDEHGADRISDHQVVLLHQEGWDDNTNAPQRISDNVEKNSCRTVNTIAASSHHTQPHSCSPKDSVKFKPVLLQNGSYFWLRLQLSGCLFSELWRTMKAKGRDFNF